MEQFKVICAQLGIDMKGKASTPRPMSVYREYLLPISSEYANDPDSFPEVDMVHTPGPFTWQEGV